MTAMLALSKPITTRKSFIFKERITCPYQMEQVQDLDNLLLEPGHDSRVYVYVRQLGSGQSVTLCLHHR